MQQPGEQRALRQRQIGRGLAEIGLRRRLDAVSEVAEIGLVEVEREDVVLAVGVLQFERRGCISRSLRCSVRSARCSGSSSRLRATCWVIVLPPADHLAAAQVDPQRADDADDIDAGVAVEVGVLGADDRLLACLRDAGERDGGVAPAGLRIGEDFVEQLAVAVVDARRGQRHARLKLVNRGQVGEQPDVGEDAERDHQHAARSGRASASDAGI